MEKDYFLSEFKIIKFKRDIYHTSGRLLYYNKPCIGYITKGRGEFFLNGKKYVAEEGSLIYIPLHAQYYSVWHGTPQIEFYSVSFELSARYLNYCYRFQIINGYPEKLFREMYVSHENNKFTSISKLYELLGDIYSKMTPSDVLDKHIDIEPAIRYIEENYTQPIRIEELRELCHCSESALFKAFHKLIGISPVSYKHSVMIQHALDMLHHTDKSIEEISAEIGFSSSNYFRKVFIKHTGKRPNQLRANSIFKNGLFPFG